VGTLAAGLAAMTLAVRVPREANQLSSAKMDACPQRREDQASPT
jgi:hypothetical protein